MELWVNLMIKQLGNTHKYTKNTICVSAPPREIKIPITSSTSNNIQIQKKTLARYVKTVTEAKSYQKTVNLPQTNLNMLVNAVKHEPESCN